jgi:hypothetical protein
MKPDGPAKVKASVALASFAAQATALARKWLHVMNDKAGEGVSARLFSARGCDIA